MRPRGRLRSQLSDNHKSRRQISKTKGESPQIPSARPSFAGTGPGGSGFAPTTSTFMDGNSLDTPSSGSGLSHNIDSAAHDQNL